MAQAFLSSGFVGGRPARLGSETFTANGTYNANNFNNAKGQPLDGFSQITINTPYEAILDGSVETIDTSVTSLRASAFASMTALTKLVLRNASSLLSTIQNALPTDLSQGTELNIYVPSSSLEDYAALYGSVYTVNDISLYGRYWFTPTTTETTLTSDMYVSGIMAYLTSTDPYDGLSIPSTITALGSGSLTPITSPTSALGIYDLRFEGNIAAFSSTKLTDIDSNFANASCPIKKFRYNGTTALYRTDVDNAWFFYGCNSIEEIYCQNIATAPCWLASSSLKYISCPNATSIQTDYSGGNNRFSFSNCTALQTANFPKVTSLGYGAFANCTALTKINFQAVTSLVSKYATGNSSFSGCTALQSVSLPSLIVAGGFKNCSLLSTVYFPSATSIGEAGFEGTALASVSESQFPLVTSLSDGSFGSCSSLTSVSLPLVKTVGAYVLSSCSSLESVSLPLCESIGSFGFYKGRKLASVSFPLCKTIGASAFSYSTSLSLVDIPMVTSIGNACFYGCSTLNKCKLLSSAEITFGLSVFTETGSTCKVYFPYALIPTYWVATNISAFTKLFVGVITATSSQTLDSTLDISGTSHNVTWYSDENLTTVFSGTPVVGTKYYAKLSA